MELLKNKIGNIKFLYNINFFIKQLILRSVFEILHIKKL